MEDEVSLQTDGSIPDKTEILSIVAPESAFFCEIRNKKWNKNERKINLHIEPKTKNPSYWYIDFSWLLPYEKSKHFNFEIYKYDVCDIYLYFNEHDKYISLGNCNMS